MEKHKFEIIFASNDVKNIQDGIGRVIGYREISYPKRVTAYVGPRHPNRPNAKHNCGPGNLHSSLQPDIKRKMEAEKLPKMMRDMDILEILV